MQVRIPRGDHPDGGTCLQPASDSYSKQSEPLDGSSERLVIHPRPHFCSPFPHRGMRKIRKSILECCCLRAASHDDDMAYHVTIQESLEDVIWHLEM